MATEVPFNQLTFVAAEDLSSKQFHAVRFASTELEVEACDSANEDAVGILQNNPASGEEATVMIAGRSKFNANGGTTAGEYGAVAGADGDLTSTTYAAASGGDFLLGQIVEGTGSDDEIGSILIGDRLVK